jgi:hypothetical protein
MKSWLFIYFQAFINPTKSFRILLDKPNYFSLGFIYIIIPTSAYTLMYIFLTIANGAPSAFTPWLNISKENYYFYNRFLLPPSMLLCWFTATAFIQVVSHPLKGSGSFEQTLSVLSLSISIAMWGGLIHDLPMSFLSAVKIINAAEHEIAMNSPTIWRTLLWICYGIYFIAFIILFTLTVRVVQKLSWARSIAVGVAAFIIFQLLFLVFNR